MNRRILLGGLAVVVVAVLTWALWPAPRLTPEEQVRRTAVTLVREAENRDVAAMMALVSERFRGAGGLDKEGLRGLLAAQLLGGRWVRVFPTDLSVAVPTPAAAQVQG